MKFALKQVLALFALFCIKLLETVDTKKRLIKLRKRFEVEHRQQPSERGSCGHQKYLLRDGGKEKERECAHGCACVRMRVSQESAREREREK